ncbi:hypothetical protein NQ318_008000 [Aromia moschata]|uniref:Uncharacterized protein n=1 Tax=Aromia moschata TaxID=1265417 RepID=A0AAV8XIR1_9CUCU|nr:hypothetical protein NQ318_008000 [Aromia moschata]
MSQIVYSSLIRCFSRSTYNHSKSLMPSPSKSLSGTPSLSHKKSHKTPKEKRRSSKSDFVSPSIVNSATQWYTLENDGTNSNILNNSATSPVVELTQEIKYDYDYVWGVACPIK